MSNKTVLQLPTIAEINKEKGRAFIYAALEATEFLPEEDRKIPYSELPGTVLVVQSNITAKLDALYHTVTTCTITDPTPFEGKGYVVRVINGTTTIAGLDYIAGQIVVRTFHSGSWLTFVYGKYGKVTTNASVSGTYNIDLASDVDTYNLTLTGATTFTISNAPTGDKVRIITMRITGNHAITWWSGVNPTIVANYVGTEINKVVVEAFSGIYDVQLTQI